MSVVISGMDELRRAMNNLVVDIDSAVDDAVRITAIKVQLELGLGRVPEYPRVG